jgi:hypothetical protein
MKNKKLFALPLLAVGILFLCMTAYAQNSDKGNNGNNNKLGPYRFLTTIPATSMAGGSAAFDISWVDSKRGRYYLANRGTGTTPATAGPCPAAPPCPNITVIDTERDELIDQIFLTNAPNGVVAISRTGNGQGAPGAGILVVGTTPNTGESSKVLFIDLDRPYNTPFAVDTGGHVNCTPACRSDELAYDPRDHIILVANDRDQDLFVTLISTEDTPQVVGKIFYDGSTPGNPKSTGGIEQPVWDKKTRRFYLAIPATVAHPKGEVDEIDPVATPASGGSDFGQGKITRIFPTTCSPAGLVRIPGQRLMTSCGDVLDVATGTVVPPGTLGPPPVPTVPGVAGDEIWFNSGDGRVYFGFTPAFVVDAETYKQIVDPSNPNGPPIPAGATHSIAADSENNHIFIPVTNVGVKVYTDDLDKGK